jgi:hypothetical protein
MNTHSYEQGVLGESLVSETLAEFRPPYWHVDNLIVPFSAPSAKTTQIDHILASPFGIFVFETKKFRGAIAGVADDKLWFEILGRRIFPFSNPIHQNRRHVSVLSDRLSLPVALFQSVIVFVGVSKFLLPGLPGNVISTIAPGVPKLRRYIQQFTTVLLTEAQLSSAIANLLRIKRNGLTLDDHLRSLRHAATGQSLPPWENGVKNTFDVGAMSASAKMTQSNKKAKDTSKGVIAVVRQNPRQPHQGGSSAAKTWPPSTVSIFDEKMQSNRKNRASA